MKTYCRGLRIDRAIVEEAYREWREAPAGKKNAWRVAHEHGSAANLIDEVAREIEERRLAFEPIHRYDHIEPTNGKVRTIGVSSVKQQLVDYVVVHCCADFLKARVGHYQASSVKGKGATFTMRTIRKWVTGGGPRFFVKMDVRKCYPSTRHDVVLGIFRKYVARRGPRRHVPARHARVQALRPKAVPAQGEARHQLHGVLQARGL